MAVCVRELLEKMTLEEKGRTIRINSRRETFD
ncbi:MAG: hypothetical protein DFNUSKGM_002144 [Candidatus Fervidibacter sacchari]